MNERTGDRSFSNNQKEKKRNNETWDQYKDYIVNIPSILEKYSKSREENRDYLVNIKEVLGRYRESSEVSDYIINLEDIDKKYLSSLDTESLVNIKNVIESWKREPLPEFKIIASPDDPLWDKRVKEELEIFSELVERHKTFYKSPQFIELKPKNKRKNIFTCLYLDPQANTYKKIEIKLPNRYPYQRPVSSLDDYGKKCLSGEKGGLEGRWRSDGGFGIAHYLAYIIGPLISLEKNKLSMK